jgi:hypothetical protein
MPTEVSEKEEVDHQHHWRPYHNDWGEVIAESCHCGMWRTPTEER